MTQVNGLAICAGVGGLELGLKLALPGYRTVCYIEREVYAAATLVARMEDKALDLAPIWDDLTTFGLEPFSGKVDVVAGGFPCQPFSVAGARRAEADPRNLWPHVQRLICGVRPGLVFLENVPGLLSSTVFEQIQTALAGRGYDVTWDIFSAASVGAPHIRKRLFILAADSVRDLLRIEPRRSGGPSGQAAAEPGDDGAARHVAHAFGEGQPQPQGLLGEVRGRTGDCCTDVADSPGLGEREPTDEAYAEPDGGQAWTEPGCGGWWDAEPLVGRVAHGVAHRVDRLRACGNGVVPLAAAHAFLTLHSRLDRVRE